MTRRSNYTTIANDRLGWHNYYTNQFNKNPSEHAEQLACWYLILHLAFD